MGIIKYWLVNNYDLISKNHPNSVVFVGPDDYDFAIVDARVDGFKMEIFNELKLNSILLIDPMQLVDREFLDSLGGFDISNLEDDQFYYALDGIFARHQFAKTFGSRGALATERAIGTSEYLKQPLENIEGKQRTILIYDDKLAVNSYQDSMLAYRQLLNLYPNDLIVFATETLTDQLIISNRIRLFLSPVQTYFTDDPQLINQYLGSEKFDTIFLFAKIKSAFSKKLESDKKINMMESNGLNLNYVFGLPNIYDGSARKNILIDCTNLDSQLLENILIKLVDLLNDNQQIFIILVSRNDSLNQLLDLVEPYIEKVKQQFVYDPDYLNLDGSPKTNHEEKVARFTIAASSDINQIPEGKNYQLELIDYVNLIDLVQKTWLAITDQEYKWVLTGLLQREPVVTFDAGTLLDSENYHQFLEYFALTGLTKRTNKKAELTEARLGKKEHQLSQDEKAIKKNWDILLDGN